MIKVFLLVVLAALVQSNVPYERVELSQAELQSVEDELEKLEKYIKDEINIAIEKFEHIGQELEAYAEQLIDEIKAKLAGHGEDLIEQLNEILERAKRLGIDVADCIKTEKDDLEGLPKFFANKVISCAKDHVYQGKSIIDSAKAKVNGSIERIKHMVKQLGECGSGWSAAWCKVQLGYEVAKESVNIPIELAGNVASTVKFVKDLRYSLQQCAEDSVEQLLLHGEEILDKVASCVEDKIKPSTEQPA